MSSGSRKARPPSHIAIIMDGNGRWAQARGLPRSTGHGAGVESLRKTVRACMKLGVGGLTVYSFSTENWRRPTEEIDALFALMRLYMESDLEKLVEQGVHIRIMGSRKGLDPEIILMIERTEARSCRGKSFDLNIAFNYGGRAEILEAARAVCLRVRDGDMKTEDLDEATFAKELWSGGMPEPEMIIRTGGEFRLSNFLLWGSAYAELVFSDVLWPDFKEEHLQEAIEVFCNRRRRFGAIENTRA